MPADLVDIADSEMLSRLAELIGQRLELDDPSAPTEDDEAQRKALFQARRDRLTREYEGRRKEIVAQREAARAEIEARYQARKERLSERLVKATQKIRRRHKERLRAARNARDEAQRAASAEYEQTSTRADEDLLCRGEIHALQRQTISELAAAAEQVMDESGFETPEQTDSAPPDDESRSPRRRFVLAVKRCREALDDLKRQAALQRNLRLFTPVLYFAVSVGAVIGIGSALGWTGWHWILGGGAGGPLLLLFVAYAVMIPTAKRKASGAYLALCHGTAHARTAVEQMFAASLAKYQPREIEQTQQRDTILQTAEDEWKKMAGALKVTRDRRVRDNKAKVNARREQLINKRQRDLADLEYRFAPQLEMLAEEHEAQMAALVQKQQEQLASGGLNGDGALSSHEAQMRRGAAQLQAAVDELTAYCQDRCPPWESIDWDSWQAPVDAPTVVKFGRLRSTLEVDALELPALISFPERPSLVVVTDDAGRSAALAVLRSVMLRMLTSFPRGELHMRVVLPGGESVPELESFHPAVEFVDQLPDAPAEHDHHSHAPASALVMPDFPGTLGEEEIGRVVTHICAGTPVFVCIDRQQAAQRNFHAGVLAPRAIMLEYDEGVFRMAENGLEHLSLSPDAPPTDATIRAAMGVSVGSTASNV